MKNGSKNRRLDRIPKQYKGEVVADIISISNQIKKRRQSQKLTQEGLAELLNVEPTTIQGIEQMRGRPSLELLLAIVKALKMRIVLK